MDYVVGVDAGGSKTQAWAVAGDGLVLAEHVMGPANALTVGVERAADTVAACVERVAEGRAEPALVCIGMAGIDRGREWRPTAEALRSHGLPQEGWERDAALCLAGRADARMDRGQALFDHDAMIALAAATGCEPGVVVVAGTGSIAFGVDRAGQRLRCGGWGHLFDDLGSGYWIGCRLLEAVFQAHDGRGEATALSESVCQALAVERVPLLTERVYQSDNPKATIASLAARCGEAASAGDPVAQRIIHSAGDELARMAEAVLSAGRFAQRPVCVGLQGGAAEHVAGLRDALARRLAQAGQVRLVPAPPPPVAGAAMLAMKALGWPVAVCRRRASA